MIVYICTNRVNGKLYIGKTVRNLSHAKARHHQRAKFMWKYGVFSHFYTAIRKYGFTTFAWEVAYTGTSDEDIQAKERELIAKYQTMHPAFGYNMTPGGDGGAGKSLSDRHKSKLSARYAGEGNPQYGKMGEAHPAWGNKHTQEAKDRIRAAHLGRKVTVETRAKLSATRIAKFAQQKEARQVRLEKERERRKAEQKIKVESGAYKGENAGPSKVTDEQRREICLRRTNGESYASISRDFPIVLTGVRAICKDWGPMNGFPFIEVVAKRASKKLDDNKRSEICNAYLTGTTISLLATEFNVGETTIHTTLRQWGPANGYATQGKTRREKS
jgi:group I intron endonuclease